jgi:DUF1365 family protein
MLTSQGSDPAAYPYAYFITAPRFLGYHFNPVSFWYLYDADKRLAAMILEVNNTFDERRMYFLPSDADSRRRRGSPPAEEPEQGKCSPQTFKQAWPKDFHVSPFNSRKGSYTVTATDPLSPTMQGIGPVSVAINLLSSKGHLKLVTKLFSVGTAIDPAGMTPSHKLRFLATWCWVGLLTYSRILKEAYRLFVHRRLHVWFKPEPLAGTTPRRASPTEQQAGLISRWYVRLVLRAGVGWLLSLMVGTVISICRQGHPIPGCTDG